MCVSISVCLWVIYTHYLTRILAVSILLCYMYHVATQRDWRDVTAGGKICFSCCGGRLGTPVIPACPDHTKYTTIQNYMILYTHICMYILEVNLKEVSLHTYFPPKQSKKQHAHKPRSYLQLVIIELKVLVIRISRKKQFSSRANYPN